MTLSYDALSFRASAHTGVGIPILRRRMPHQLENWFAMTANLRSLAFLLFRGNADTNRMILHRGDLHGIGVTVIGDGLATHDLTGQGVGICRL